MLAGSAIAGVFLLGTATVTEAQQAPSQSAEADDEDDNGKLGLLGLVGLAGLAGLAGLKRRDDDHRYDDRTRTR